ncbi:conjugal transfer protein [Pseudomonas syringae pv. syringae]|nr:conjugal transfer protein [Pseudomonas syringae]MCK9699840.1 conjugal transfer protein [Pseudomonas syringae pv. syringae]MCK9724718.1 conjugal transfer protein [Pseudomonas syringae pv. syringae]
MMIKRTLVPNKGELGILLVALACLPSIACADWLSTLQQWGSNIRLGLYLLAGTLGLICLIWSGAKWLIARSTGDRSHTFMDYLESMGVLLVVGGSVALGTAAWQVFGTGVPG